MPILYQSAALTVYQYGPQDEYIAVRIFGRLHGIPDAVLEAWSYLRQIPARLHGIVAEWQRNMELDTLKRSSVCLGGGCGEWHGGRYLCSRCQRVAELEYPQGWSYYPGDRCKHGVYVGGCGADYMCGRCENA